MAKTRAKSRDSEIIKRELSKARTLLAVKKDRREELAKQLEQLDSEINDLLKVTVWGNERKGKIAELEQELVVALSAEYKQTLPKAVVTKGNKGEEDIDYRVEKVTAKRIYLTSLDGIDFYVQREGSDFFAQKWGLDIPATIAAWEAFTVNNSPSRGTR